VIGVQPIPLADMPILTTLQTLMVGMIIHTTGRPFSVRLVAEFLGALGFDIGARLVLREGARAIVKVIPIWGNAVSGFIAGAGTYAIGKAAIAYFIEENTDQRNPGRFSGRLLPRLGRKKATLPSGGLVRGGWVPNLLPLAQSSQEHRGLPFFQIKAYICPMSDTYTIKTAQQKFSAVVQEACDRPGDQSRSRGKRSQC